ncbi:dinucleotide-utilizing enzyme [Microbacterium sp.]|uniref:dinucleotide-utilizing enzyme n=1 Tax=Microbacterium sp. TaxID=51671 RepID=UPI003C7850D4
MPNTAPRVSRSIPFWVLVGGSVVAVGAGTYLLVDKLGTMTTTITDGTATAVDVYVGQIWAVVGAILAGAGLIGVALALTVGSLRALVPGATAVDELELDIEEPTAADTPAVRDEEVAAVAPAAVEEPVVMEPDPARPESTDAETPAR